MATIIVTWVEEVALVPKHLRIPARINGQQSPKVVEWLKFIGLSILMGGVG